MGARAHARPVRGWRQALRAVCARDADRRAGGHPRRGARHRATAAARAAAVRAVPDRGLEHAPGERLIEVAIKKLRPDAVVPARAYAGDAGLDLSACERIELQPG